MSITLKEIRPKWDASDSFATVNANWDQFNSNNDKNRIMDTLEITTLLHELIAERNKCDSELYFEKNTNFDKRDNAIKKISDLNNTYQEKK